MRHAGVFIKRGVRGMKSRIGYLGIITALLSTALVGCGGGGGGGSDGTAARATIVLANDSALSGVSPARGSSGGGPVPIEDILSLTVSITEISLQQCGGDDTEHGAGEQEDVHVSDFMFDPACVTIEEGGTVRWEWETDTLHTITSGSPGDLDAGVLFDEVRDGTDSVVELVFEEAGIYPYFSDTETDVEEGMAGIVKVVEDDDGDHEDRSGGEGEGESEQEEGETIIVHEGAFDVNLLDLSALSEVLTTAEIPAGKYCRIILQIENPRLVLVDDPETEITDIHLTANGRLFIKDRFEVGEQEDIIIVLNFGGIHLVQKGNGGYVLTPKVRAEVNVDEHETAVEGEITSINADAKIIEIESEDGSTYEVLATDDTVIKTDDDSDDGDDESRHGDGDYVHLKFEDLQVGQRVEVEGTLSEGGQILADVIVVGDESYVSPAEVEFEGEITSIDPETQIIEVQTAEELVEVQVTGETEIKTDEDGDDETEIRTGDGEYVYLKFEDLQVGQTVEVEGLLIEGEPVRAHEIEIADEDFVSPVVVEFYGEILSVDAESSSVQVQTDLETYTLLVNDNTTIKTDNDADDEVRTSESEYVFLKFEDLAAGQSIEVRGYLIGEAEVRADRIEVDDEDYETPPNS